MLRQVKADYYVIATRALTACNLTSCASVRKLIPAATISATRAGQACQTTSLAIQAALLASSMQSCAQFSKYANKPGTKFKTLRVQKFYRLALNTQNVHRAN